MWAENYFKVQPTGPRSVLEPARQRAQVFDVVCVHLPSFGIHWATCDGLRRPVLNSSTCAIL